MRTQRSCCGRALPVRTGRKRPPARRTDSRNDLRPTEASLGRESRQTERGFGPWLAYSLKFCRTDTLSSSTSAPPPRIRPRHHTRLPPSRACALNLMTCSGCGAQKVSSSGSVSVESSETRARTGSDLTDGSAAISSGVFMRAALSSVLRSAAAAR